MDFLPQKGLCLFSQILEQIEYGTSVKHTVSPSRKSDTWQASLQFAKDPMRIINCELFTHATVISHKPEKRWAAAGRPKTGAAPSHLPDSTAGVCASSAKPAIVRALFSSPR